MLQNSFRFPIEFLKSLNIDISVDMASPLIQKIARDAAKRARREQNQIPVDLCEHSAPLVAPVPKPFNFLESDIQQQHRIVALETFVKMRSMRVWYQNLETGKLVSWISPEPIDGVDEYFARKIHEEFTFPDGAYKLYSCGLYEPFTELKNLVHRQVNGDQGRLCSPCRDTLKLCCELTVLGTYHLGNMIAQRISIVSDNFKKNPCTCGVNVAYCVLDIVNALVDGIRGFDL